MSARAGLSKVQIVLIALVVAAGLAGAAVLGLRALEARKTAGLAARVGAYEVTQEQLALRQAHANVYYPGSGTPEVALAQLIQGYLAAELMKQQGVELDRATWLAEEERIDKQTRDPATLEKIKFVYAQDHESYLYVGILPDFAQSRIFKLFRSSTSFSEEARVKASAFLDEAERQPASFAALAEKNGLAVRRLRVDPKTGLKPETAAPEREPAMRDASPKSEQEMALRAEFEARAGARDVEAARSLLERVAPLAEGQVYGNTLEAPESYEAVRLVRRYADGSAVVEMVSFVKPDFGRWFWAEAGKIPVTVFDPALRDQFAREVSWAKQLNLQ